MAVLLTILKITGIVLLCIIGFVLFLLLILLYVPIRYKVRIDYDNKKVLTKANVSFLLHLISINIIVADGKTKLYFWKIPINKEKKEKPPRKKKTKKTEENEEIKEKKPLLERYIEIRDSLFKKFEFIDDERTSLAVSYILKTVFDILKAFLPRKLKGHVTFGLSSPSDTGKVLGICGALIPIHKNRIKITPVFDNETIISDVILRGHIAIGYIVHCIIKILINKNVRYVIKNYKYYLK